MLISIRRPITFRGAPAQLSVLRNDGYCWGRIVTVAGEEFDVDAGEVDLYDEHDVQALDVLEALAAKNEVSAVAGWPLGWDDRSQA